MIHGVEIADKEQGLLGVPAAAQEHNHAFLLVAAVDPLKSLRRVILLIESRVLQVELIESLHIGLHILVERVL